MEPQNRRPSFDITDNSPRPPSPAPTYYSTFNAQHTANSISSWWTNPKNYDPSDEKSIPMRDLTNNAATGKKKGAEARAFKPVEEPFNKNHPLYAAPSSSNHYALPKPKQSRIPPHRVLIPWILALIFFLTTLWFTSIAVGVRFFNNFNGTQQEPPSIYVVINGNTFADMPSVSVSMGTQGPGITAPPSPSREPDDVDNSGNNTLVTVPPAPKSEGQSPSPTRFSTVLVPGNK